MRAIAKSLDRVAWESIARSCREADAAFVRVGGALLHACPVAVHDQWSTLRGRVVRLAEDLSYASIDQVGSRARVSFQRAPDATGLERPSYGWPGTTSLRKRRLAREEWVAVGDDVKRIRGALQSIGMAIQPVATKPECMRWFRCVRRLDHLKCHLDDVVYAQHPEWGEFCRVFYGSPSEENPQLLATLHQPPPAAPTSKPREDLEVAAKGGVPHA